LATLEAKTPPEGAENRKEEKAKTDDTLRDDDFPLQLGLHSTGLILAPKVFFKIETQRAGSKISQNEPVFQKFEQLRKT